MTAENLDQLAALRVALGRVCAGRTGGRAQGDSANKKALARRLLDETLDRLEEDDVGARKIIEWLLHELGKKRRAAKTIHLRLQDAITCLESVGQHSLLAAIELAQSPEALIPEGLGPERLRRYFGSLRSFYRFYTGDQQQGRLPDSLRYRQPAELSTHPELTPDDLEAFILALRAKTIVIEQTASTAVSVADMLTALVWVCAGTGLRISEALNLKMGDIWVTGSRLAVMAERKRGKWLTTEVWPGLGPLDQRALALLRRVWSQRQRESGDAWEPFFVGTCFSDSDGHPSEKLSTVYQRLRRLFASCGMADGPHAFRRLFANTCREQGLSPLDVSNLMGHSTTTTAPLSYLQIYPRLQREQLAGWAEAQDVLQLPEALSLDQLAAGQSMTREGVYRLIERARRAGRVAHSGGRDSKMDIDEALEVLRFRVAESNDQHDS